MSFLEDRAEMIKIHGPEVCDRRTGQTTACCLDIISQAMRSNAAPIPLYDHYSCDRKLLRHITVLKIEEIILKLGLECFSIDKKELTLTYDLGEKNEKQ